MDSNERCLCELGWILTCAEQRKTQLRPRLMWAQKYTCVSFPLGIPSFVLEFRPLCLYLLMYACLGLYTFSHLYFVEGDIWGFVSVAGGGFSLPQWVALLHKHTDLTLVSILTGIHNSSSPSPRCASKNPISRRQKDNGDKMTVSLEFFSDFQKRVMYL